MAHDTRPQAGPHLERIPPGQPHTFTTPSKRINDGDDLTFFLSSTAYRDLTLWLLLLNRSMFPTKTPDGKTQSSTLSSPPQPVAESITQVRTILDALADLIERAPPSTAARRFGNPAFRDWCKLAESEAESLLDTHLAPNLSPYYVGPHDDGATQERKHSILDELRSYLLGSFGSGQRLDYGTGHELSFLAFLGSLWKLGVFPAGSERSIVMGLIQPYLELVRKLIMTYTLEPAGSHGVWGLDDHSFLPYIFGSAQFGPAIDPSDPTQPVPTEGSMRNAPPPTSVMKKDMVSDFKESNMYFSAIQFIYDVKRGPFWEHSPVLYDISGIKDGWGKINKGMLKMYAAEVLGKFPVVQHFPFGSLFRWEADPQAVARGGSVHAQQQPPARSMDVPVPQAASGTQAPWATASGGSMGAPPQMQASTGVPTARMPRAHVSPAAALGGGMAPTAAPWGATQRAPPRAGGSGAGMAPTPAPWARKDGNR